MYDTVTSTLTVKNLFAGNFPVERKEVTIAASQTITVGTVIGKATVAAGTAAAGSNTGDGAVSAFALAAGGPAKIGTYVATCIEAVTNSGIFNVVDPDGILIGQFTVAVSDSTTFTGGGITFNVADGTTDFIVGDLFNFPVTAGTGYGVALDTTNTDGSNKWAGVALEEVTTGAAETQKIAMAISGDFHSQGLTFGGSTVYTDVIDDAKENNCYIHVSYSDENFGG